MPEYLDRRAALRIVGAAGAGLWLGACGGDGDNSNANSSATTSPEASTTSASGPTTTSGSSGSTRAPAETGGPFPADGTNGPNVLDDDGVVRRDIAKSFGRYSGTAAGVPLTVDLKIVKAGSGAAYPGAALYLWHCDAAGRYSLYSEGATDQNYCRGVLRADSTGGMSFATVFPAAYAGRWPHLHYSVYPSLEELSAAKLLLTSQIAIPKDPCDAVYEDEDAYPNSARNMRSLMLETDGVFRDSYKAQVAAVTGSVSAGYTVAYTVVV